MKWWGWVLLGLVAGAAGVWVWGAQRAEAARTAYQQRLAALADSVAGLEADRQATQAHADSVLVQAVTARASADSARRQAQAARQASAQARQQLALAATAADSVPLLAAALSQADSALAATQRAASTDSARAVSAEEALGRTTAALADQVRLTARWRAVADSAALPPPAPGRMPLLNLPWPKALVGLGVTTNGKAVTPGLTLAVGFTF